MPARLKIRIMRAGEVCVSPYLPYGGRCPLWRAAGFTTLPSRRLWLPVLCFLIYHPQGLILFDTGWPRAISPAGVADRRAQLRVLDSFLLYLINQGRLEPGAAVSEQLEALGITSADLSLVLLSHLDCDHAAGLKDLAAAGRILAAPEELKAASRHGLMNRIRYRRVWWEGCRPEPLEWNGTAGPAGRSADIFGDGSLQMILIPGHSEGLCALKVTDPSGRFALLFADGGYSSRSWRDLLAPGIAVSRAEQMRSLEWIREQSLDPHCVLSLASHDPEAVPGIIEI